MLPAGGTYRFRGLSQPTVSIIVKHYGFKTVAKGYRYLEFRDGSRIDIHYPVYYIKDVVNLKGLITSNRPRAEVDGEAVLVDTKNRIKVVLNFGALKNSKSRVLRRSDAVTGFMYRCSDAQVCMLAYAAMVTCSRLHVLRCHSASILAQSALQKQLNNSMQRCSDIHVRGALSHVIRHALFFVMIIIIMTVYLLPGVTKMLQMFVSFY